MVHIKKEFNMWVLNVFFLEIAIGMGCNFGLCSQPSKYYNRYTHTMNKESFYSDGTSTSYAKELMYID